MKVLHNRQLQSSPFHSFIRFLKMETLSDCLMSVEIPCHSLHSRKEILSNPYRNEVKSAMFDAIAPPQQLHKQGTYFVSEQKVFFVPAPSSNDHWDGLF